MRSDLNVRARRASLPITAACAIEAAALDAHGDGRVRLHAAPKEENDVRFSMNVNGKTQASR
jgi:hypothetical protein